MIDPENTLARFRDVVVVNSDKRALAMSQQLRSKSLADQRECFGGNSTSGFFWIFTSPEFPEEVMECAVSSGGDAITSLYKRHRIFGARGDLIEARTALIAALESSVGLSRAAIGVDDPVRRRTLGLAELATGQLIDLLAEREGCGLIIRGTKQTTSSTGGDLTFADQLS